MHEPSTVMVMADQRTSVADEYTGHVESGSAARRTIAGASIVKVSVGPMDNNAYLITCSQSGQTLLVDAANDAPVLLDLIERYAPTLALIVTTHQHGDHWQALAEVASATGAPTAAHQLDAAGLPVTPDRILSDGDTVEIGELTFDVIHLQGHTEGRWPSRCAAPPRATPCTSSPVTACFPAVRAARPTRRSSTR